MPEITKPIAEEYGEPQLKTVLKYAQYINAIASAREATFREDNLQMPEEFWQEIKFLSYTLCGQINDILNPDDLGL